MSLINISQYTAVMNTEKWPGHEVDLALLTSGGKRCATAVLMFWHIQQFQAVFMCYFLYILAQRMHQNKKNSCPWLVIKKVELNKTFSTLEWIVLQVKVLCYRQNYVWGQSKSNSYTPYSQLYECITSCSISCMERRISNKCLWCLIWSPFKSMYVLEFNCVLCPDIFPEEKTSRHRTRLIYSFT